MFNKKVAALGAVTAILLTACGDDDESSDASVANSEAAPATSETAPADTTATTGTGDGCTVGVSWFTFQEERYGLRDEPGIKAALEAGGAEYISNDGKNSAEIQASNVENLITQGVDVLVIDSVRFRGDQAVRRRCSSGPASRYSRTTV